MARLNPDTPFLHPDCEVNDTQFGRYVEIGRGSRLNHSSINDYSYCDRWCDIANTQVGKFSNIAASVRIGATDHPMEKASLHHFHYRAGDYFDGAEDDAAWFALRRSRRTVIGHDTWLGHGAQVRPEVSIGHGAVVAGGAIVTRDVPSYMIVAGIPAKPLRRRFSEDVAARMEEMAWWDWPHERLETSLQDFQTLAAEAFLEKYG
ncbi:chloramphenicol acetyltransferase [Sulfitobacter sp. S0837]|uniref:chloramphenicol acetyltransferase n=1 Tax=Sulfitobacter maritimus TaxID=2741719 RepID=UPI0015834DE7|nr:chloramphenicol acetyltransferase [Sulfitobacter maritimus]NUH65118.1 chloramphenicol acetyltransferase [Sulfitobacter maritimus]